MESTWTYIYVTERVLVFLEQTHIVHDEVKHLEPQSAVPVATLVTCDLGNQAGSKYTGFWMRWDTLQRDTCPTQVQYVSGIPTLHS